MKAFIQLFFSQVKRFCVSNGWIFVLFALGIGSLFTSKHGSPVVVTTVFLTHFVSDIFIMMMMTEYAQKRFVTGTIYQIFAMVIFFLLKMHSGFQYGTWYYAISDILYLLAATKSYYLYTKGIKLKWINVSTMTMLSLALIVFVYLPFSIVKETPQWIQTAGIFIFAISLCATENEKHRYFLSLVGLLGMVAGSGYETVRTFMEGNMRGLAFSYFLLPATVLIYYLSLWRNYFHPDLVQPALEKQLKKVTTVNKIKIDLARS